MTLSGKFKVMHGRESPANEEEENQEKYGLQILKSGRDLRTVPTNTEVFLRGL